MSTHELHLSDAALGELARRLAADATTPVVLPAGVAALGERRRWLVHPGAVPVEADAPRLIALGTTRAAELDRRLDAAQAALPGPGPRILVALGLGPARGHVAGRVEVGREIRPLKCITVVGPGMPRVPPAELPHLPGPWDLRELLSRTIGALGLEAYTRLRAWHVAVVGCGRSGSLIAEALAAQGLERITLVDPDRIEPHNLGEMAGLGADAVGRQKAAAVAAAARRPAAAGRTGLDAIVEPLQSLGSLYAIKPADVLVSCPDAPAARLAAAVLACVYLKPLLDIGTAVLPGPAGPRMGADVRLVLPGRCLVCLGGVNRLSEARDTLLAGRQPERAGSFETERLGSLRSLNTLAVGLGLLLMEQLAAGRLPGPVWLQADLDEQGLPRLTRPAAAVMGACALCALTARGDAGLQALPEVLRRL